MSKGILKKATLPALLIVIAMSVTSCGFSLRSNDVISSKFSSLYLNLQQPNGEFARNLKRSLSRSNVSLAESPFSGAITITPVLSVSDERLNVQPVTVTPAARAAQYEIVMSVAISMTLGENSLIASEDLVIRRVYFEDTGNITGNLEEV
ncbi:MAG: hypothetical protein JKY98_00970, partial [Gammaproteobacteria bacterium]|nr:hypothetical protein [Gammaproteobacteria bacterium]